MASTVKKIDLFFRVSVLPPEGVRIGPGPGVPRVPGSLRGDLTCGGNFRGPWGPGGPVLWRTFSRSLGDLACAGIFSGQWETCGYLRRDLIFISSNYLAIIMIKQIVCFY